MKLKQQNAESTGFLVSASILISSGVAAINSNFWAGVVMIVVGAALFLARELRKSK